MIASRRQFLASGAACVALAGCQSVSVAGNGTKPIGVQLFTLRDMFAADPHGTLEKVAAIGYREVEFGGGGYEAMDHAALRRTMDVAGLRAPSLHVGYDLLLNQFDQSVEMARVLGADTVILPHMTNAFYAEAAWTEAVANFNRFAERLSRAGLGFAYHNHDFEFTQKPGGVSLWDRLVRDREADMIKIEFDLFWAVKAGVDVKALIRGLPGQFYSYHVKDMAEDGWMAAVGTGSIDFADIFTLNELAGVRHFIVENDRAPEPWLPDIATSFTKLSRLLASA